MNIDRINRTADTIEIGALKPGVSFNMRHYITNPLPTVPRPGSVRLAGVQDEPSCGTAACIAGTASILKLSEDYPNVSDANILWALFDESYEPLVDRDNYANTPGGYEEYIRAAYATLDVSEVAASWLGLDGLTAASLFMPLPVPTDEWSAITTTQAVACLRHLAKTGKVDWVKAIDENPDPTTLATTKETT